MEELREKVSKHSKIDAVAKNASKVCGKKRATTINKRGLYLK